MSKFKVGDLVTPSKFFGGTTIGKPYEVICVYSNAFMITNDTGDKWYFPDEYWTHYGQKRASNKPKWLPCPPDYKPQDNHEVTYHMGVPTHYYVTEPVLVDVEKRVHFDGVYLQKITKRQHNATIRGKTHDGKPVGQWTIDMDAD